METGELRFDALRNALYHKARQRWLEGINRTFNFFLIVLGTATAADVLSTISDAGLYLGAATTIIAALQLVFDFGGRANLHDFLQRRYYEILAEVAELNEPTPAQVGRWNCALYRIYGEEPPPMRALDAAAYNEACDAMGAEFSQRLRIAWYHQLFRHIFAFQSVHFVTEAEYQASVSRVSRRSGA